ncbi:MAG: hypothetical protein HWE21_16655, partial [Cytophagia bacterium]|nr:hypothetical protein [Cytophagia bacterium]
MNLNNMRKANLLILYISLLTTSLQAQQLKFVSNEDGLGIPYLTISFQQLGENKVWRNISSLEGVINIPDYSFPLVISTSHINFKPVVDTLYQANSKTYRLQPAITDLDEVIVTGQFAPQSVRNSVF